ncbi:MULTISPECIES: hypothetical protein [unclassified Clostridioides]|uniref:hypothetical protein n=1 Tax=unclassified Clostridioides TaxID=2635829 RepID=UPI001D12FC6A|nr:hypothetical protein [Clostridioides sp. ES-S-0005-03]UDN63920.1 hypothetical protein IC758_10055 [Clostridioides sp. ES-W-0016-02]
MALFGDKVDKEDKKKLKEQEEIQKFMNKYQLQDLNEKDLTILRRITDDLFATGLIKTGLALSFTKIEEQTKINYLSALVEQNWMIIRQLSQLNSNIEKLVEDKK